MAPHPQRLTITRRTWTLARPTRIGGELMSEIETVVAEISDGDSRGRAEAVPLRRFGETPDSLVATLEGLKGAVYSGLARDTVQAALPPGAARNAMDCAFWDVDADRAYCTVADLAGLGDGPPVVTAFTIGCDTPAAMAEIAAANRTRPLLRLELGGEGDDERIQAVRAAAPAARIVVDAAESWDEKMLGAMVPVLVECRILSVEQPLPADADGALAGAGLPIPVHADESCVTVADLDRLDGKYAAVTIKLDKVGGLTSALAIAKEVKRRGLGVVAGGSVSTSLGIAPGLLIARGAEYADLCGPLLLAGDRPGGLRYDGSTIHLPNGKFWGQPG